MKLSKEQKAFNTTSDGQKAMYYAESRNVVTQTIAKELDRLQKERFELVANWRKNGCHDTDWAIVETHDVVMARYENMLSER